MSTTIDRELTFGEKLVGINFNPSGNPKVQRAKELCALLADLIPQEAKEELVEKLVASDTEEKFNNLKNDLLHSTYVKILETQMMVVKILTLD
jgi:hypothetical protein